MNVKIFFALILTVAITASGADEKLPVLTAGSETYSNVTIINVSATDVYFTFAGGMSNVKLKKLPPALQKHFNFDPKKAQAEELKQAANNAQYHDQVIRQPVVHPPDLTREAPSAATVPAALWRTDYADVLKQAQAEDKLVLLDFTGSDWCPWCIKFDHDVLSTDKFAAYAGAKLGLVKLDFPLHTPQDDNLKRANAALARQFRVDGYPTYVLVNSAGKELGRQVGYLEGGPAVFIAELEGFSKR